MKAQIIEKEGKPEYAVLQYSEYQALIKELEELQDIRDFDFAMEKIEKGEDTLVPSDVVYRILDGVHSVRAWREYRNMTLHDLAQKCSVTDAAISQIENGKREPSVKLLKKIAETLEVGLDDLVV
jgi:DNA-binding XRE family transcriptional regulator